MRSAFQTLLEGCGKQRGWKLIPEYSINLALNKRSGITNDLNRPDDPQYIIKLIGKVITVSLETVKLVKGLPEWPTDLM